jgi:hypothetical protein
MKEVCFSIINWDAWAPNLISHTDWQDWAVGKKLPGDDYSAQIPTGNIPPMQLRRLSNLTKMSLKVALECTHEGENVESIFASRYGEWTQTLKLLQSISSNEEVSPAGFSMSVHNTAAGIYSILAKNTESYTAIAGCSATFAATMLEAIGRLQTQKHVLVVIAEEAIPEIYSKLFPKSIMPYAIGLLIGRQDDPKSIATFKINFGSNKTNDIEALDFLKWLLQKNAPIIKLPLFEISHAA